LPSLEEHARRSEVLYGDPAMEIHKYIDSAYEIYGGSHRKIRHDVEKTPAEVQEIFGKRHKSAHDIAIDHIWFDAMDSCSKIGIGYGRLSFVRFMKPHFMDVTCKNCRNRKMEKFADVYVYKDWEERYDYYYNEPKRRVKRVKLQFILITLLTVICAVLITRDLNVIPAAIIFGIFLFFSYRFSVSFGGEKTKVFSHDSERYGAIYYCFKCHKAFLYPDKEKETKKTPLSIIDDVSEILSRAFFKAGVTVTICEEFYSEFYPELSKEEAVLQEIQEVDMDFEGEANQ